MKKGWFFLAIIPLLIWGCGPGEKPYNPQKGILKLKFKEKFKLPLEKGLAPGKFSICKDSQGYFYLSNSDQGMLVKLNAEGKLQNVILGQGEFFFIPSVYFVKNTLWVITPNTIAKYTPDGEKKWQTTLNKFYEKIIPLGDDKFLASIFNLEKSPYKELLLLQGPLRKTLFKTNYTGNLTIQGNVMFSISLPEYLPDLVWAYSPINKRIIIAISNRYSLGFLNLDGRKTGEISLKAKAAEFPMEERKKIAEKVLDYRYRTTEVVNKVAKALPSYLPIIKEIVPLSSGAFLVKVIDSLNSHHWDYFSPDGQFLYRIELPKGIDLITVLQGGDVVLAYSSGEYSLAETQGMAKNLFE